MKNIILLLVFLLSQLALGATNYNNHANCMGSWAMESGTGEDETDLSGEGGTLTRVNNPVQTSTHMFGTYAADFEYGSAQYYYEADAGSTDINGQVDMSIVCWVNIESFAINPIVIVSKYDDGVGNQRQYRLMVSDGGIVYWGISTDGSDVTYAFGATSLNTAEWYHIAATYEDGESSSDDMKVWVNGSIDTNGTDNPKDYEAGIYNGTANFSIGSKYYNGNPGNYFDGIIDDVGLFNISLSSAQINEIKNNGMDGTEGSATLILPIIQQHNRRRR